MSPIMGLMDENQKNTRFLRSQKLHTKEGLPLSPHLKLNKSVTQSFVPLRFTSKKELNYLLFHKKDNFLEHFLKLDDHVGTC